MQPVVQFTVGRTYCTAEVLKKYPNIVIVADEIYEHINFSELFAHCSIPGMFERTITVNGAAKDCNDRLRIGYIMLTKKLQKACTNFRSSNFRRKFNCAKTTITAVDADPSFKTKWFLLLKNRRFGSKINSGYSE
jgi:aspartate aminotransferase